MKEDKTLLFVVDDKTKMITDVGDAMPFGELKRGMRVSVRCKKEGDKMIAVRIRVLARSGQAV